MERLKKKDAEAGIAATPLTDAQRASIAEARSIYEAKVAERKILHQSALQKTFDPAERETLEESFRRDLDRFESDRESRVAKIRAGHSE